MSEPNRTGMIAWVDLTVEDAPRVRDFYAAVTGWQIENVEMRDGTEPYHDFCMTPPGETAPAAGICHRRGRNSGLPPAWLIYITVDDLDASLKEVETRGGRVLRPATDLGPASRYAVIADPAGCACALFEQH